MKYADLHVHTFYSDSTFSPEEVVSCARDRALAAIAICDHDSVDGIEPCLAIGDKLGVEILPGIELSAEKSDAEIHILGYLMDYNLGWLRKRLKELQEARIDRIHKMVERLNSKGIDLKAEDVFKIAGRGTVGRLHLALAILNTGKVKTIKDVFGKYIGFRKPCYVANLKLTPEEAISIVLRAGGVPVLAHPGCMGRDEYIPELIGHGLRGIEVYHTDHGAGAVKRYQKIAEKNDLLVTGGSDCHGLGKGRILLGEVRVPYTLVERLKEESGKIKNEHR
ncbi:MAG: PHP domain-containing protein [Candidatus Omnitrophica bacterium]|nr:PHP domain-containing protein [Candidatus Omnitrophota bacterium]